MDPMVALFFKHGITGILAGVGFYLFFMERKETRRLTLEQETKSKTYLDAMISDTAAKTKLLDALEDLTKSVDTFWQRAEANWNQEAAERAKEEGRREVTGRFLLPPTGGSHEPK
jgi:ABC-type nitrate/sulfonate/bicarbonate transport system substrate-binding protein